MKTRGNLFLTLGLLLLSAGRAAAQPYQYPFQNPDLPLEDRVNNALSLMTSAEKISLFSQGPGVQRLGIRRASYAEGLHGVAVAAPGNWGRNPAVATTTFSQSIGLGETWDVDILHAAGAIEGYEARYVVQSPKYRKGGLIVRAPNADLGRDPRWGRTEECYGEDPFLNGTLVVAFVKGMQGDDPKYWQAASLLEALPCQQQREGPLGLLLQFRRAAVLRVLFRPLPHGLDRGRVAMLHGLLQRLEQGPHDRQSHHPRRGRQGVGRGRHHLHRRRLAGQHDQGPPLLPGHDPRGRRGDQGRLDQRVPGPVRHSHQGRPGPETADHGGYRQGRQGCAAGPRAAGHARFLPRNPYAKIGSEGPDPWTTQKSKDTVRLATQKSIVLLKNAENLLPLDKAKVKSIALIGPFANLVVPDWYSSQPPYMITPLAGVKAKVGEGVKVEYAAGKDVAAAAALAKASDVAILCVGNNPNLNNGWTKVNDSSEGRESIDRQVITLGSGQEDLIQQVYAANPKTVVVLVSSFPYAINWAQEHVPAILHMAHNSQEEGNALADVLFGDYNPAGRLVQTWPKSLDQLPTMMDYDIRNGRTYMYFKGEPLYPFGYGLSYTTFEYSNLRSPDLAKDGMVVVAVNVQNTGKVAGEEVVQLYVKHLDSAVSRPGKELRGFQRIALKPGERKMVEIPLLAKTLAYWNVEKHAFVVEAGKIELQVGRSSADICLKKTLTVKD